MIDEYRLAFVPESDSSPNHGNLCVAYRAPQFSEPKMLTVYYPVTGRVFRADVEMMIDWPVYRTSQSGEGRFTVNDGLHMREVHLLNGGKTLPIRTDSEDILPPKTRLPVKFEHGLWHKQTSKGWVIA